MIGIAVVAMFGTGFASSSAEVGENLATSFRADLVVRPTGDVNGVLDQDLLTRIAAQPAIRTAVAHGGFSGRINGSEDHGWVSWYEQPAAAAHLLSIHARRGRVDALRPGEVVLASGTAKETKAEVGDTLSIENRDHGTATYRVVGILADNPVLYDYTIAADDPMAAWARQRGSWQYDEVYLEAAPGGAAAARASVDAMLADEPDVTLQTRQQYIAGLADNNDTGMIVLQVMLGIALLIAALGVVNTMVLSVIERTRELGLLRAIGLGRQQTVRMIAVEAVVVSLLGAVLGVAAGVGLAFVLQKAQNAPVVVPWTTLVAYLVGAAVVGLVAAVGPAIRAGRLDVLAAIGHE
jgi:putative ABC transport system permease protein